MAPRWFLLLTAMTSFLAGAALLVLPYLAGVFPGGFFEDASVGPVPLWLLCSALVLLLAVVCGGALISARATPPSRVNSLGFAGTLDDPG